jgi:hypothetical protein
MTPRDTLKIVKFHIIFPVVLGGVMVIVLANGPKVHGFKPGRQRWIIVCEKSAARLPSEGK